jgi:hypothetical protein
MLTNDASFPTSLYHQHIESATNLLWAFTVTVETAQHVLIRLMGAQDHQGTQSSEKIIRRTVFPSAYGHQNSALIGIPGVVYDLLSHPFVSMDCSAFTKTDLPDVRNPAHPLLTVVFLES